MRLRAWLSNDQTNHDAVRTFVDRLLGSSHLLGINKENMVLLKQVPQFNSDYMFASIISAYGVLAGVLVTVLLVFLIMKIFRISFRQGNQLGMLLGCGCGTVFLVQLLMCLAVNLGLFPSTFTTLPFFVSGGSTLMVSYILLGLVLSIYRYKNILKEPGVFPEKALTRD